jgi:hypothetical protein
LPTELDRRRLILATDILYFALHTFAMARVQGFMNDLSEGFEDKLSVSSAPQRSSALSNRISSVLSASYADSEIRDALRTLDERKFTNSAETRRRLRIDVQREVIERNGDIVKEFGHIAEVRVSLD